MTAHIDVPSPAGLAGITPARSEVELEHRFESMGGTVRLRVAVGDEEVARAEHDLRLAQRRIEAWARRLTRFSPGSDLARLNADPRAARTPISATLGLVLQRALVLGDRSEGLVDVSLLDARSAAEAGGRRTPRAGRWWLEGLGRRPSIRRKGHVRFDLDGVGKGWIADRALALLCRYRGAMVDADGDVALRAPAGSGWRVAVADPWDDAVDVAELEPPQHRLAGAFGVATSGTVVHRWDGASGWSHHLIDPRSGGPALTDVVQATVVAESAMVAEALAKAAVIAGSAAALGLLERAGAWAAVLVRDDGGLVAIPEPLEWPS